MNLTLQFPPTPANAMKHAEIAVEAVKKVENVTLDFTPASLQFIDKILYGFRKQGLKEEQIAETVFSFGCYAGEIFARHQRGDWVNPIDVMPEDKAQMFPFMVVKLPNGYIWNPIGKAFKTFENGEEDSLARFYWSVTI